jgi:HK97 family phage portal protein
MNALTKAFTKALTAIRHAGSPAFWGQLLKRTRFDYRREVGDGLDSSVVTAPVMWVGRALPEARLAVKRVKKDGETEEQADHGMLALIQAPNPFYGDIALWMVTILLFLISGNAYWRVVRNGAGKPAELWFIPNWTIEPKWPADGSVFISHYEYTAGGEKERIDPADVIHFRHGIDPRNHRMGLSPIDGAVREIFMDLESSNFVASLLRNMGVPGVVISPKGGAMPAPEDVEATKAWFKQAFGGDNRGGPLVMGAPTDVTPYGFNPQQMNMSEARDVAEERVCACLGIPAAVVGFGAGLQQTKVGATMEELRKLAWNNGVLPMARMLADELQRSLLPLFPRSEGLTVSWDTSGVLALQEDEDKKSDRALKQFQAGLITHHQALEIVGQETPAAADFYLRPIAAIEVPVGSAGRVLLPSPRDEPKAGRKDTVPEDWAPANAPDATPDEIARGEAFVLQLMSSESGLSAGYETRLRGLFTAFGEAASEAARPLLDLDPSIPGKAVKEDEALVAMILEKLGIDEWTGQLRRANEAQYLEVANSVQDAAERAGLGASLPDEVARAVVAAGGRRAGLVDLDAQTRAALFEALAQGRAEGEGAAALAGRIAAHVESGRYQDAATRARMIARTETKYAQNISTIERARAAGVTRFIVFDGRFGPPRSELSHIARNGKIVSAEDARIMADSMRPNCTLSFAPHFG